MDDTLLNIRSSIEEAAGWLETAQHGIAALFPEGEIVEGVEWFEMLDGLCRRLATLEHEIIASVPPLLQTAFDEADAHLDEIAGLADAGSY